ncbi:cytochrome c oxidase subunit 3 [Methylobacterium oryzisoli]|uniref:cytochrome c oxidase subunit 3 n=1 Tax=Methylobacterium oryzisoli TaxID=3385502 RepID=UPI0038924605
MSLVLLYLAGLGLLAGRWLLRQRLAAKPWLEAGPAVSLPPAMPPARLGLTVFLAAVGLLFALLTAAYAMRVPAGAARVLPDPRLVWLTTGLLVLASFSLHLAGAAARHGERGAMRAALLIAAAATLGFLAGQGLAWRDLLAAGLASPDAAGAFFVLITGLHALHIGGGLAGLGAVTARAFAGAAPSAGIALCALYWDALLAIWLVLFGLLFRTPWSGLLDALCRPA